MPSSTEVTTHLLSQNQPKFKPYCSPGRILGLLAGLSMLGGSVYIQNEYAKETLEAVNRRRSWSNDIWDQIKENSPEIFNMTQNGSCIIVKNIPCNYTVNTHCDAFNPYMENCNSGDHNNLTTVLATQNPAPCTTPLDKRIGNSSERSKQLLSNYTATCDGIAYLAWHNLSPIGLTMMLAGAISTGICFFKPSDRANTTDARSEKDKGLENVVSRP